MFKRDPDFKNKVTPKNTMLSVLWNIVMVGMLFFAIYIVRIEDAPVLNRLAFYSVWGVFTLFGMFVFCSYIYYLFFKK